MKNYVIDRIEGSFAVLEESAGCMKNIPLCKLPEEIKEGDILAFDEKTGTFSVDNSATQERTEKIKRLTGDLFH